MIAVLDTNIIVSGLVSPRGSPARVLDAWRDGLFHLAVSSDILNEIEQVLNYPKLRNRHRLTRVQIKSLITALEHLSILVPSISEVNVVEEDPSDDMFIACAVGSEARCVVTGDNHLLSLSSYRGIDMVSPGRFLDILKEEC